MNRSQHYLVLNKASHFYLCIAVCVQKPTGQTSSLASAATAAMAGGRTTCRGSKSNVFCIKKSQKNNLPTSHLRIINSDANEI
jgi:hypothetical protein